MAGIQHIKWKNQRKTSTNHRNFALCKEIRGGEANEVILLQVPK